MKDQIINKIKEAEAEFIKIRRHLHENPELGFEEVNTSNLVAEKLTEWGYTVHRGMAKTGVVGTLKVGDSPKTIGIRADMDALPIVENTGKPWTSKIPGKFHGCGHDGHTTILLSAAKYLAENRNFNGTIHLIFQPAEELLYGGRVMIEDGLFKEFPCDIIFGMHNMPGLKEGVFGFKEGPMMASSDTIHIEVKGKGSHGAVPENGIDATLTACYIATALQSIVSRNVTPFQPAVITIGCIESGVAPNVVNDYALMKLTVRSMNNDVRQLMLKRITEVAENQAKSFGATAEIKHINGSPVLINGKEATDFARKVAEETFGKERAVTIPQAAMGSEDFAFMLEANPNGSYMIIGNGNEPGYCYVHNPGYDFNDNCIVPASAYWAAITETYLN